MNLSDIYPIVYRSLQSIRAGNNIQSCTTRTKWAKCKEECGTTLRKFIQIETESTAYMLRILCDSILSIEKGAIEFHIQGELTGIWKNDVQNIVVKRIGKHPTTGRLLFGFGPSASGKTFWANKILRIFTEADPTLPKTFVTIDGGIYRSSSLLYQTIIKVAEDICIAGLDNLVATDMKWLDRSLFYAGAIKKQVLAFLERQTIPISLYVPEHLRIQGKCILMR